MSGPILIVLASANRRGAELQGAALGRELAARGHVTRTVALSPAAAAAVDVPVIGRSALSVATLRSLRREIRAARVVVGYGSSTLPACTIAGAGAGRPFVYRSIGDPAAWVRGSLHRARTGLLFRRADRVAALFDRAAGSIHDLYRVPVADISILPNARNDETYSPPAPGERAKARRALGLEPDRLVVTYLGAFQEEKRPLSIVDVACAVPEATFLMVGGGPLHGALRDRIDDSDPRPDVRLMEPVDDVRPLLAASDMMILASRTEGMPGALIEAALTGVPAVAPDVGAVREVVGAGGVVVRSESSAADYAAAIRTVAADRAAFGRAARGHAVAELSWTAVAPRWEALLAEFD